MNTEGRKVSTFCLQFIGDRVHAITRAKSTPLAHKIDDFHGRPTKGQQKFIAPWEKGAERETSRNFNRVTFQLTLYKRKS